MSIYAFNIWNYLEFQKTRGFKKWGPRCRFTSSNEFRVDVEAAVGDITCRCCQWSFLKARTRTILIPQPIIRVPGLIAPLHCSTIELTIIKCYSHQTKPWATKVLL